MSEPNDKLDKAAQDELMALLVLIRSQRWTSDYALGFKKLKEFILAAKRSKELEKENAEFHRTEPLKLQERNRWQGLVFDLIKVFPHDELETEGEVIARMVKELQQLSTLRTAYKQALEALKGQECHCLNGESKNTQFGCPRCQVLSNSLAIETMKGEV